ncbi:MgtC/SapB family protein [Paenibacillus sp. SAFN-117]|uniref:MgtC/SapB family protein n=1 Tax=Paenibacillus sp. SAFN-117 TaxID=3436860 RepID=UPI003F7F3B47
MLAASLLRLTVAGICGALIGYERKNRMKDAGIRTHFMVSVGAALMILVSKYGFQDQIGWDNLSLDPSRIAAQVVSGVSFLGAGMIFLQRQTVKSLTTAAGIWATSGIGMAIGAGLYWIGISVTVLILIAQVLLHGRFNWLEGPKTEQLVVRMEDQPGAVEALQRILADKSIAILNFQAEKWSKKEDPVIELEMVVRLPSHLTLQQLMTLIQEVNEVRTVSMH